MPSLPSGITFSKFLIYPWESNHPSMFWHLINLLHMDRWTDGHGILDGWIDFQLRIWMDGRIMDELSDRQKHRMGGVVDVNMDVCSYQKMH